GPGGEVLQQPVRARVLPDAVDARRRVLQVTEGECTRRAGLRASGDHLAVVQVAPLVLRLVLRGADALHAERALLHHALRAHGDVGIELEIEGRLELRVAPIEDPRVVRAVVRAVARADAAVVDHRIQAFAGVVRR